MTGKRLPPLLSSLLLPGSWRRGSVVRRSVFGQIYGRKVTTLLANCPMWVSQLGQLSLPSLRGR